MKLILSQLNAEEIAACIKGSLSCGSGDTHFPGISIDSRTLRAGELFFAIRGPRQDGHQFIPNALLGADMVTVSRPPDMGETRPIPRQDRCQNEARQKGNPWG